MNIFYLSENTEECAKFHCDKHVVKMILEYSQLLSTAHRVLDGTTNTLPDVRDEVLYKATHVNHPSAIWVRKAEANYQWLYNLLLDLHLEYKYRYNKVHRSSRLLLYLTHSPIKIPNIQFTQPDLAMPEEYKSNNAIVAYRKYYAMAKQHLHNWKNREVPEWLTA